MTDELQAYYDRKNATRPYAGFRNLVELATAYEQLRERYHESADEIEALREEIETLKEKARA